MGCAFTNEHVYIGSRYVPQIEGLWDINKEYESLSIVVDVNSNSYTSKKNVPAGIELTNTEYWVKTGNFEGAIEQELEVIRGQITIIEQDITNLENKDTLNEQEITNIKNSITTINQSLVTMSQQVSLNGQNIDDLDYEMQLLKQKTENLPTLLYKDNALTGTLHEIELVVDAGNYEILLSANESSTNSAMIKNLHLLKITDNVFNNEVDNSLLNSFVAPTNVTISNTTTGIKISLTYASERSVSYSVRLIKL